MPAPAPLPDGASLTMRALRFADLLEDNDPVGKLSWSKIGVAFTTFLNMVTTGTAALQAAVGNLAHVDWHVLAIAGGAHVVTRGAHEIKRYTEAP